MSSPPALPRLTTLGRLRLYRAEGDVVAQDSIPLLILAYLAAQPHLRAPRDQIAMLVWPAAQPKRQRSSLRQALYTLRRWGAGAAVADHEGSLELQKSQIRVDLWEIEALARTGAHVQALRLARGPFLEAVRGKLSTELTRWAEAEDTRIQVVVDEAFDKGIARLLGDGEKDEALEAARRWVAFNPIAERRVRILIETLLLTGQAHDAVQEARRFRALVRSQIGDQPTPQFLELERSAILAAEAPSAPAHSEAPPEAAIETEPEIAEAEKAETGRAEPDVETHSSRRRDTRSSPAWSIGAGVIVAGLVVGAAAYFALKPKVSLLAGYGEVGGILTITEAAVTFEPSTEVPAPGTVRSWISGASAHHVRTSGGSDVVVVDGGNRKVVLASAADEQPLDWSPDGERLLYWRGWYDPDDNVYSVMLGTWDRVTGASEEFRVPGFDGSIRARWSPDGSRVAIGGGHALTVVTPDGEVLADREAHGFAGTPAWSPSGRQLAVSVWDGTPADVFLLDERAQDLVPIVRTPGHESHIAWLNDRYLLAISRLDGRNHLILIDTGEKAVALLAEDVPTTWFERTPRAGRVSVREAGRLFERYAPPSGAVYVDSVKVARPPSPVSPGEYLAFPAIPLTSDGRVAFELAVGPRWDVQAGLVAEVGRGVFRALGAGRERIAVSFPGWRSSTIEVVINPPLRRALPATAREEWEARWTSRWASFGEPPPRVRTVSDESPGPSAFEPRGDQNYASGAVSRRRFGTAEGVTVELWARIGFTQRLFQSVAIGLTQQELDPLPTDHWSALEGEAWVALDNRQREVVLADMDRQYQIPLPDFPHLWRRYALQVRPTGEQLLLVDGRVHFRSPAPSDWSRGDSARVVLSGQAVNAEILIGPLEVYEGELYGWSGSVH